MKYLISICIVACCALAIASSTAFADESQAGKCNFMSACGKMSHKMETNDIFFHKAYLILAKAAELGLSSEQTEKVKALKYSVEKSLIKKNADIESLTLDIKEALRKDEIDINAVDKLIDQKYTLKAQKTKETIGAYAELKKILTPDQLKKLKEMRNHDMKGCHKGLKEKKESMTEEEGTRQENTE